MKTKINVLMLAFSMIMLSSTVTAQYKPGDKVEDFKLQNIDGEYVSMSDYKDAEGIILIFTCNTCPFAIKYEDRIIALHETYAPKGYPVIALNPNCVKKKPGDSMKAMKERAKDKNFGFAYLRDNGQKMAKKYGAERTPEIFLLEKKGNDFYLVYTGTIDNNVDDASKADEHYVKDAVDALIAGKDISVKSLSYYCNIIKI